VRILLFTGKGGVGKTTLAAATAVRLAAPDRKVLVVSTDPAHSLADAFGVPLSGQPSEVDGSGLWAAQLDVRGLVDDAWQGLRGHLRAVLSFAGLAELAAEELTVVPGIDELLALTEVATLAGSGQWDAVVVDCGPTAETLRLLALPEAVTGYLKRIFPARRAITRGVVAGLLPGGPHGLSEVESAITRLAGHLGSLRDLLTNVDVTAVRLVLTPERLVVAESRRTLSALALRGIRVEGVIANRLVPKAGMSRGTAAAWLRTRRAEQEAVLAELRGGTDIEIRVVEHRAHEPVGLPALGELARELYGDRDPLAGERGSTASLVQSLVQLRPFDGGTGYRLKIAVPLTKESEVDVARVGNDLAVTVDGLRRMIELPAVLRSCVVVDAEVDGDGLVLSFQAPVAEETLAT
jgi:arsenite-transporting ATPase